MQSPKPTFPPAPVLDSPGEPRRSHALGRRPPRPVRDLRRRALRLLPVALLLLPTAALARGAEAETAGAGEAVSEEGGSHWAIALHGGAGVIPKDMPEAESREYFAALEKALRHGADRLAAGARALDVVEEVVRRLEDAPQFNAGKGAVFTHDGRNELDAALMDGRDLSAGAVAGLTTVKNPITLARGVMEKSKHVFLVGHGAEAFGAELGVETVDPSYFFVQRRYDQLQRILAEEKLQAMRRHAAEEGSAAGDRAADGSQGEEGDGPGETLEQDPSPEEANRKYGTVGCVVLDRHGDLAAGTSTGGLTNKRFGRVGDVPVIGAGTYANNATVAVSGTGWGEKFIRHNVAHSVSALVELAGLSVQAAAEKVIHQTLDPGDGGVIVAGRDGSLALVFNTPGMFRGAADSKGRFGVAIWED